MVLKLLCPVLNSTSIAWELVRNANPGARGGGEMQILGPTPGRVNQKSWRCSQGCPKILLTTKIKYIFELRKWGGGGKCEGFLTALNFT
jgi:hypothetical protein